MSGAPIVVFVSAGKCGTAWLASMLRQHYPGLEVEHEPIGAAYQPRRYFRRYDAPDAILEVPEVRRHLERIEDAEDPYVETGWPLLAAVPLLAVRMADRLRVVHLTRHPVPTALLHLVDRSYAGSEEPGPYSRLATLGPGDPGVFQPHYSGTWDQLSAYEKCLFWWTEVNLFALELPGRFAAVPFTRVKAEALLSGDRSELARLLEFMNLPWEPRLADGMGCPIDRWPPYPGRDVDPLEVHRHPATVETARELGYDLDRLTPGAVQARYRSDCPS